MKKVSPILVLTLLLAGCTADPFENGIKAWNENDFDRAQKLLLKVDEQSEHYDSAQVLLAKLPDAAVEYWITQARANLANHEFDAALDACERALFFRFEDKDALRMKEEIKKSAAGYWTNRARERLQAEELAKAFEAVDKALEYQPEDRAALRVKEKIIKAQERRDEETAIAKREEYAQKYEKKMLDKGMNVEVSTKSPKATTLKVDYPQATEVEAHKFSNDKSHLKRLRKLGFEKLILTGAKNERWVWDLAED
jgi:tetratricopeptide (TPR) repeat protein